MSELDNPKTNRSNEAMRNEKMINDQVNALDEMIVDGIKTNLPLHQDFLPTYSSGLDRTIYHVRPTWR